MSGQPVAEELAADARDLLLRLSLPVPEASPDDSCPEPGRASHATALLRAAGQMSRIFELRSPDAPGLAFVGGTADPSAYGFGREAAPASASGRGFDLATAFASCVGEAVEYLSNLEWPNQPLEKGRDRACMEGMTAESFAALMAQLEATHVDARLEWLPARSLTRQVETWIPADLCLWRQRGGSSCIAPPSRNTGCGSGESLTDAILSGLLELIERDAAALWWIGGRRPRAISVEHIAAGSVAAAIERLRGGSRPRRTWFLDITTDLRVPCVAAVSVDASGRGLAFGLAARASLEEAVRTAMLELCQMELGNRLVAWKCANTGEGALTPKELRRKRRADDIDPSRCALLYPAQIPDEFDAPQFQSADDRLAWVVGRLREQGIECFAVDMTRKPIGIPSARVLSPTLQPMPSAIRTARLERTIDTTGGGRALTDGIDLL